MSTTETPPTGPEPTHDGPHDGPRVTSDEVRDLSRLRRTLRTSPENRYIAGVAGGIARHLDVDPVLVRVLLVVLTLFGGAGILLYIACWLLVPEDGRADAPIRLDERTRALALYAAAGVSVLALLGNTVGHWGFPWPLAILAVIVLGIVSQWDRLRAPRSRRSAQAATAAAASAWPTDSPTTPSMATPDAPAPPTLPTVVMREPDPRKKGPILFWFTLALIALAEGVLGVVDAAGANIVGPAYPALAVGIIGVMLVIASVWGRGGGLIFIGLVASLMLAGSTAAHKAGLDNHSHNVTYHPTTASAVLDHYDMKTGTLELDLTRVTDPQDLAGRTITLDGHVGQIRVELPASIAADGHARVRGVGHVVVFGDEGGGFDSSLDRSAAGSGTPLTIDAGLNVGEIRIEN